VPLVDLKPKSIFGIAPVAKRGTATRPSAWKNSKNNTFILKIQGFHRSPSVIGF
jgi:hypothetical protein